MDAPVKSLPSRPVRRDEVERFEDFGSIDSVYPVYGQQPQVRNDAVGLVLHSDGVLYAVAYRDEDWHDIEQVEVGDAAAGEGVHLDDWSEVETLQDEIGKFVDGNRD